MVVNGVAFRAKFWTEVPTGDPDAWDWHLNCDGTERGAPALLAMPNPKDPVHLFVPGWPNHVVAATPAESTPNTRVANISNHSDLSNTAAVQAGFEALIATARAAGSSTVILRSDALDNLVHDKGASLGTINVQQALNAAAAAAGVSLSGVNGLTNDAKGWTLANNLIMNQLAPNAAFGWELSIGSFAHNFHSGHRSVWNSASKAVADLLMTFGLYDGNQAPDFMAFTKSASTPALDTDQWDNALRYVKQVTDFVRTPAMLSSVPTSQAGLYFMGQTSAERKLRHAAHHNVFAVMFDNNSADISTRIANYMQRPIPLYSTSGGAGSADQLTRIPALNASLEAAAERMNNEAFLYETPNSGWVPSTIYKWDDFLAALNSMHNVGVAGNKYWLIDENADDETNIKYAKVAIAAFLAQSMQETIRYNACDENNWDRPQYGAAPVDYPMKSSCGQLTQVYGNYGINPVTGRDHPYSCAQNPKMEITATTHAEWYGAPGPIFTAPDAVLEELGLLVNGNVGRWDFNSPWCSPDAQVTQADHTLQAWERADCQIYPNQKAGGWVWDGSSQQSVEGCGWWGRGVIQTTGRQNFGTLNHFLGRSHVDPATIGTVIDGQLVAEPPSDPLYANIDLCSNPQLICTSQEHPELKWIAGLFFWMTSVQGYENDGGPYADWNYFEQLKAYVDGGMRGTKFIDDVSGIVNRGCPDVTCPVSGDVHALNERRQHFNLVLRTLGLNPN